MKIRVEKGKAGTRWYVRCGHYSFGHDSWEDAIWRATGLAGI